MAKLYAITLYFYTVFKNRRENINKYFVNYCVIMFMLGLFSMAYSKTVYVSHGHFLHVDTKRIRKRIVFLAYEQLYLTSA